MANRKVKQAKEEVKIVLRRGRETLNGVSATTVQGEMQRIYSRDGDLKASVVLDESRPEDAPMHPVFEWDDFKAAEQYRIDQARHLIRSVEVIQPTGEQVKSWVHVPKVGGGEGAYHPPEVVVAKPDYFALAISEAQARLKQAEESVRQLEKHANGDDNAEQLAKIAIAMQALHTAGAAVSALH